jgi:Thiolase, C-terminal domain
MGMTAKDIDLFEVKEPFAAVMLKFLRDVDVEPDRVNVNGGAIALGDPIGAPGPMLLAAVLDELERRDKGLDSSPCAPGQVWGRDNQHLRARLGPLNAPRAFNHACNAGDSIDSRAREAERPSAGLIDVATSAVLRFSPVANCWVGNVRYGG